MNITHLSVSRKSVWDECKKKYHFKYHLKIDPGEEEPFYFTYGKIIHKIAEEFVREEGKINIKEITSNVLDGTIALEINENQKVLAPKDIPFEYKIKMNSHLGSLVKLIDQTGFGGELEWNFKYDLDPPNQKNVVGFIDRLINKKNNFFIIDYKTTKRGPWRKNEKTIKNDLQLMTYARVVQKKFNVPAENINTALYYLEGGNLIATKFTQKSLDSAELLLKKCYNDIEEFDAEKVWGNVGNHCKRCEFRNICPFFKN